MNRFLAAAVLLSLTAPAFADPIASVVATSGFTGVPTSDVTPDIATPPAAPAPLVFFDDVYVTGHGEANSLDFILGDQLSATQAKAVSRALHNIDRQCRMKRGELMQKPVVGPVACSYYGVIALGKNHCVVDVETNFCRVPRR